MCAFFLLACRCCGAIRKRPAWLKSLSAFSFSFIFSPPHFLSSSRFFFFFYPSLRFTRPSHTSSKGLPDTPLSEALKPYSFSVTSQCACVCEREHLSERFEISHFLPTLPPQRKKKKSGGGRTKREVERGELVGWVGGCCRLSDCCSPTQRRRKSQRAESWPAAS